MDLFDQDYSVNKTNYQPLAYRMRPRNISEIVGQKHLLIPGKMLRNAIERDELHPFVLYGPPGTGKTTIAQLIAHNTDSHFEALQAVTSGVKDIKKIAIDAKDRLRYYQRKTILFVDEIHRFNKSQQDVLLPFVEDGTLLLIGATTENPLYELNNALLSRMKLYVLKPLEKEDLITIIMNATEDKERGLGKYNIEFDDGSLDLMINHARGDARIVLNLLETLVNSYLEEDNSIKITTNLLASILDKPIYKYDSTGDYHYDTISAFIKSIRGSDPDAAVFWLAVMLESGEDPVFIARRLVVHAAEDIGLADPQALNIAMATAHAVEFIGLPEARIPLAEATLYLATAPKSNSSLIAIDNAIQYVRKSPNLQVPAHIGCAVHPQATPLLGKGKGYKYPPDYDRHVQQNYLPAGMEKQQFYIPTTNGHEKNIVELLKRLRGEKT
ncbi:MAG TPA: replication-associated recombination protein A [Syntrophomonadaceae bacterium]|nr:replication-associated recombination protein A [Syntrophomonadaceae bacterium]